MSEEDIRQSIIDEEHLKLLSLGYMVSAGVTAFYSLFALMYMFMGILMTTVFTHAAANASEEPPAFIGLIFAGIGLAIFIFMIALAAAKFLVARYIKRRKSRMFCMVVAGISCLGIPYGTLLGVLSFIVLERPSVAGLFSSRAAS
jgi:Na+/H+ antiporter NhaC